MKALYNDGHVADVPEDQELQVIRHSAAHIMAQAISRLWPGTDFAFGPATDNGFYYDVELPEGVKVSEDDFPAIEAEMSRIVKENLKFETYELPREQAIEHMRERGEKYKVEHIGDLPADARITFYKQGDYVDMCVGPHLTYTKGLKAFKLTGVSGAYWKGDKDNTMLTRINGIAFRSKEELAEWERLREEAERRDHRRIGQEMEIFMMSDAGPGFPFWLPNGMRIKNALMQYWQEMQDAYGYEQVQTPIILSRKLWETSGHWDHYKENMYTTSIDDEDYAVKPMNCPGACLIYKSRPRSYRDLPLKLAEAGLDHRHELKGALHGLFRVREFTQDDAHLFIRPDQITEQVTDVAHLITAYYHQFGFPYRVELSTRPEDSMGSDEDWERAEQGLKDALESMGVDYVLNPGDGAFYGPKIDFHLTDCLGRSWQCGTIQLDFQLPERFGLEYTAPDGSKQRPIMIHRAGFGSFERFTGMLIEQYEGKFPTWLAPLQVKVLPVSEKSREYAHQVADRLREAKVRVKVDDRDEKIGYKIREARSVDRVPYMLILGEKEVAAGNISVRDRTNETHATSLDEFLADITAEIAERRDPVAEAAMDGAKQAKAE
ncbi:MAG: threonine--tRNA ligase [Atopobiaceae bacterium]|jgi:threonyl-tRNA synthetase|nr:threonine--tRNA ligase [Atopobiaceae bacterium]MCH4120497.1 threonine--tRNA ligase [Atopobiaceae bacterium]MCI1318675.1 threonine--tRNA ligase [Atopobiaceae bacterium]MCI1389662.1 threonine--tRNA ligase [Atopobiaceae bacterium]MCI1431552.1 threonine--tRNA ligase [Atopobiaceae bacterium]